MMQEENTKWRLRSCSSVRQNFSTILNGVMNLLRGCSCYLLEIKTYIWKKYGFNANVAGYLYYLLENQAYIWKITEFRFYRSIFLSTLTFQ